MKKRNFTQENKPLSVDKIGGFAFSAAVILVLIVSLVYSLLRLSGDFAIYLSFFLPCLALLISFLVTFKGLKVEFKPALALYNFKFKKRYYAVMVLVAIGMLFGLGELNNIFIDFLSKFGYVEPPSSLPEFSVLSLILCILIIAVLPPILEEFLFRGLIMQGVMSFSKIGAIFITALLFSIYHMSPAKTIYQLAVGLIFGLICLKSQSLIPTVIIHFLNNLFVILSVYFNIFGFLVNYRIISTIIGLVCLAAAIFITFTDNSVSFKTEKSGTASTFFIYSLAGIFACVAVWIASI